MRDDQPFALCVTDISGGGVVARLQKWCRELTRRQHSARVFAIRDRSSVYSRKVSDALFADVPFDTIEVDSRDKASRSIAAICRHNGLMVTRAIVSSKCAEMGLVVHELRRRGWDGCYVEVVPSDDRATIEASRANLRRCDIAGAVSSDVAARLAGILSGSSTPIIVVPGGAEIGPLTRSARETHHRPFRICYVGRLDPVQKRIFDLPEIARQTAAKGVNCEWTIVGSGNERAGLERKFAEVGVLRSVAFLGKLPHSRVSEVLRQRHVFVLPSAFEGLSNSLCEAAEAGTVPIVTEVSGAHDVITDGQDGFLVEIGDTAGFATRICQLADSQNLWARMSAAIREKAVSMLSTSRSIDTLVGAIESWEASSARGTVAQRCTDRTRSLNGRSFLDSPWMPNVATRFVRSAWRWLRGRPRDVAPRTPRQRTPGGPVT